MKKLFLSFLLSIIAVCGLSAEKNYDSEKVVFLPQEFYVGDLVEMRVVVTPDKDAEILKPENFPESYWVKIENADVIKTDGKYELRVFLRSFAPGIRTLPSIKFGDIVLRDIRIQTSSVLEGEALSLSPPAEQIMLPGTRYYIALFVGLIFILPIFFILFWTKLKGRVQFYIDEHRRKKPYRRFQKALKDLESGHHQKDDREFYTILIDELRLYLTARGSIDYTASTVKECSTVLLSDFPGVTSGGDLIELMRLADEVKFGDRTVSAATKESELLKLQGLADEIEGLSAGEVQHVDL